MPLVNGFNVSENHAMAAVAQAVGQRWLGGWVLGQENKGFEVSAKVAQYVGLSDTLN